MQSGLRPGHLAPDDRGEGELPVEYRPGSKLGFRADRIVASEESSRIAVTERDCYMQEKEK